MSIMQEGRGVTICVAILAVAAGLFFALPVRAASSADDLAQIQHAISEKRASIDALNSQLESYRARIRELSNRGASLENDIALLENESAMAELDIAATQNALDEQSLELRFIEKQMDDVMTELSVRRKMLADLLFTLHKSDNKGVLEMVIGAQTFNDIFAVAQQLTSVNEDMRAALEATQRTKQDLETREGVHEAKMAQLVETQRSLVQKIEGLEMRKNAKVVLAQATAESENEYRVLMSELRSEQQSITNEVASLQSELQNKLIAHDGASSGNTVITWPVHGVITALFHDTTYPFRNLFEHPGLDIAVPQGTAIEAAAPGYVARVYRGQQYGYYVMIIHANGFATLYAHMSRIDVEQDQYVARGQVIGLSGGRPGTVGAGFSTGPHVHLEVRRDGIPTDPLLYLDRSQL